MVIVAVQMVGLEVVTADVKPVLIRPAPLGLKPKKEKSDKGSLLVTSS